eukprot:scaffold28599_cov26-Tisochrysis_lutea.AAC.1
MGVGDRPPSCATLWGACARAHLSSRGALKRLLINSSCSVSVRVTAARCMCRSTVAAEWAVGGSGKEGSGA